MDNELYKRFNEEVNRYKNSLLFYAKKCEWETFKVNAGRLFDYVESIETSVIEKKFIRITKMILAVLFFIVVLIFKMNPDMYPELARVKELMILMAIAGCCFEVYFFYNFRTYMRSKTVFYKKRRERFIRDIERDFKHMTFPMAA